MEPLPRAWRKAFEKDFAFERLRNILPSGPSLSFKEHISAVTSSNHLYFVGTSLKLTGVLGSHSILAPFLRRFWIRH